MGSNFKIYESVKMVGLRAFCKHSLVIKDPNNCFLGALNCTCKAKVLMVCGVDSRKKEQLRVEGFG